ncbi:transmembrane protein adipocyte-associated 1-like isoform X2 [Leptotrombidium deliense]|uniref:Transmembrane protein adipocyte-associated 1-like isoform X2 n=1 Tax=Leptotrombidium deliense TaxID=299467 RepID=A0A443SNL9_9ACAR|nr:transmembrane protein adipocyte-associated 1-like isoform X2 [Leptotrombidium deliense]
METTEAFIDLQNTTNVTDTPSVITPVHFCQSVLYIEAKNTKLRVWDIMILVPNLLLLLFLLCKFRKTQQRLKASSSLMISTFYTLVCINVTVSIIRCLISMSVNAASSVGGATDQIFWVIVRFFLLATEISVLVFALFFGHLDSKRSIRRVLIVTSLISLSYSICQGALELIAPDEKFYIQDKQFHLFGHGGMVFWFCTCLLISIIYFSIFFLPWTPCGKRTQLPAKRSFYIYTLALSVLNLFQAIGSGLYFNDNIEGLCIVDVTTYLYFTAFTPLVYWTFLAGFLSSTKSQILFSYKPQVDDTLDDTIVASTSAVATDMRLPHQLSCSSIVTDNSDFVYQQPPQIGGPSQTAHLNIYESSSFSPDSIESCTINT